MKILSSSEQSRGHSLSVGTEKSPLKDRGFICLPKKRNAGVTPTPSVCVTLVKANAK